MELIYFLVFCGSGVFLQTQTSRVIQIYTLNLNILPTTGWDITIEPIAEFDIFLAFAIQFYIISIFRILAFFNKFNSHTELCTTFPTTIVLLAILNDIVEINILFLLFSITISTMYFLATKTGSSHLSSVYFSFIVLTNTFIPLIIFSTLLALRILETERWGDILEFDLKVPTYLYERGGRLLGVSDDFNLLIPLISGIVIVVLNQVVLRLFNIGEVMASFLQVVTQGITIILICFVIGLRETVFVSLLVGLYWSYISLHMVTSSKFYPSPFGYAPMYISLGSLMTLSYSNDNIYLTAICILLFFTFGLHMVFQMYGSLVFYTLNVCMLVLPWFTYFNN